MCPVYRLQNRTHNPHTSQLTLYTEIIAVCSQIHTKHINTLCGENAEFFNIRPVGTYGRQLDLKAEVAKQSIPAPF